MSTTTQAATNDATLDTIIERYEEESKAQGEHAARDGFYWVRSRIPSVFPTTVHHLYEGTSRVLTIALHGIQESAGWIVERKRNRSGHAHLTPQSETHRHPMFNHLDDAKAYALRLIADNAPPAFPDVQTKRHGSATVRVCDR